MIQFTIYIIGTGIETVMDIRRSVNEILDL